jgi:hypothetical protein
MMFVRDTAADCCSNRRETIFFSPILTVLFLFCLFLFIDCCLFIVFIVLWLPGWLLGPIVLRVPRDSPCEKKVSHIRSDNFCYTYPFFVLIVALDSPGKLRQVCRDVVCVEVASLLSKL